MFVNFNILNQLGSPAINSNTFANRPAAGQTGRLFVSTDTFEIYRDNGTSWDLIGGPGSSTITGTGTATQVAYFTSSQAIGSSANLFWDNTSGFLGVATATPTARIEAVKTDGIGIYANYTTNAGSGSSATAIWAKNVTNSSGFAAVIEETTPNATAGQYPLLIKHSLSSGTAGVGMGTGLHFQLPDDAGTFKTTQLTIETINAAAATYATRYRFNVQNNGSSTPVAYINATGLGIFTATPGAALDIHSTGIMAQLNSTSATANSLLAFQRSGSGLWRIGDNYGSGTNYFELFNTVLGINAMQVFAATNKTSWQATETYTTGLARGNYFDYNLSVAAGGSFSSPNAITALGASLDLTLAGNATIPSGARSGLDAYNSISFNGAGTLTLTQGTQIRAYSNLTTGWAFNGNTGIGTVTHLAGLRVLFPDNTGNAINVTNNYALLLNDQTANTGTVTYTNRWGIYQEGASDLNYLNANLLLGSTVNTGEKLQVTGNGIIKNGDFRVSDGTSAVITQLITNGPRIVMLDGRVGGIRWDIGAVTPGAGVFTIRDATSPGAPTRFAINSTGNVTIGAGVSNGDNLLTIEKDMTTSTAIPDNGVAGLVVRGTTSTLKRIGIGYDTTNNRGVIQAQITGTGPSPLLLNPDGGLVGIGTSTPTTTLMVASASGPNFQLQRTGFAGYTYIEDDGTNSIYRSLGATIFQTNGANERMRITSAGLVGINTSTPTNTLQSYGGAITVNDWNTYSARFSNNSNKGLIVGYDTTNNQAHIGSVNPGVAWTSTILNANGGNVLIGTTTDTGYKLQVNGTAILGATTITGTLSGTGGDIRSLGTASDILTSGPFYTLTNNSNLYQYLIQLNGSYGLDFWNYDGSWNKRITFAANGDISTVATLKTGAPTTGTAAPWKFGSKVTTGGILALDVSNYIEVEVNGVFYKLGIVN